LLSKVCPLLPMFPIFNYASQAKSLRFSCMVDCYLCGTQYSTASLPIHYESCKVYFIALIRVKEMPSMPHYSLPPSPLPYLKWLMHAHAHTHIHTHRSTHPHICTVSHMQIKWLYNCSQLPTSVRPGPIEPPTLPIPDETSTSPAEIKAFNEESVRIYREFSLISCPYPDCMRKMEPSSVLPHMAACGKRPINANRLGASPTSPDGFANQTMHG
jgi:hypothetical protein